MASQSAAKTGAGPLGRGPGTGAAGSDAEHPPLQGLPLGILTFALALACFMQVLDTTIANVAVPTIAGNIGVSYSQGTWVITSYGVANAIGIPITGWLARRFGEVRLFLWSTALFSLASLLCGMATSLESLVFFRVLQGAVAGPMMPLSQSLLLNNTPLKSRGMALALWSMTISVAPICGPILGGYISDNYHWGWIFLINVPLGLAVILLCLPVMRGRETPVARPPMDYIGLALLVLGIGALQMMLDRGKELDWFNSTEIIVLAVVALVGITYLVAWELSSPHPVVDFSLFRSRNFTIGLFSVSLGMLIYMGTVVLIPLVLQAQLGYTATLAGLAMAPIGIFPVLLAPIIGRNAARLDMRMLVTFSFITFAGCFFFRTTFSPLMDFGYVVTPQIIQGLAVACFFMPLTTIAISDLPPWQMASGAGMYNFMRTLFGSIGVSVTTTLWERREALHHGRLAENISAYNPVAVQALDSLQQAGFTESQSAALLAGEITRQGFILSALELFQLYGFAFLFLIILVWFSKPKRGGAAPGAGADGGH